MKVGKYIDLRCDFGFKYCMSDPIVMRSFLNAILEVFQDTSEFLRLQTYGLENQERFGMGRHEGRHLQNYRNLHSWRKHIGYRRCCDMHSRMQREDRKDILGQTSKMFSYLCQSSSWMRATSQ